MSPRALRSQFGPTPTKVRNASRFEEIPAFLRSVVGWLACRKGQEDGKNRPTRSGYGTAAHANGSFMLLDDGMGDPQSKASAEFGLSGIERLEIRPNSRGGMPVPLSAMVTRTPGRLPLRHSRDLET